MIEKRLRRGCVVQLVKYKFCAWSMFNPGYVFDQPTFEQWNNIALQVDTACLNITKYFQRLLYLVIVATQIM